MLLQEALDQTGPRKSADLEIEEALFYSNLQPGQFVRVTSKRGNPDGWDSQTSNMIGNIYEVRGVFHKEKRVSLKLYFTNRGEDYIFVPFEIIEPCDEQPVTKKTFNEVPKPTLAPPTSIPFNVTDTELYAPDDSLVTLVIREVLENLEDDEMTLFAFEQIVDVIRNTKFSVAMVSCLNEGLITFVYTGNALSIRVI